MNRTCCFLLIPAFALLAACSPPDPAVQPAPLQAPGPELAADRILAGGGGEVPDPLRRQILAVAASGREAGSLPEVTVDYPFDSTVYPPDMVSPTVRWHDAEPAADRWVVEVTFEGVEPKLYVLVDGGPAARLGKDCITRIETLEYEELGMEAIFMISVKDFPAFVIVDDKGNDFFEGLL